MHKMKRILRRTVLYAVSITLVGGMPMIAFADEPVTYTYDANNQRWDTNKWKYDSASGVYVPASTKAAADSGATAPKTDSAATPAASPAVSSAGADAKVIENANATSNTNDNNTATIDNTLKSNTGTGDANVAFNQQAGGATTGDANGDTTTVNSVHSTIAGNTQGVAHFTTNIYGDVTGDITIGPMIGNATVDRNININSNTNVNNNDSIKNNLNLNAGSGNANVNANTSAGGAKSGNANAVANVINLINTVVAANKSFVGTINIYGNLNGDILVSPEFIPQLLGKNSVSDSNFNMPLSTNFNNDQSIINNIHLKATTGNANVTNNTGAGSATTGTSKTNLTVLNLTGHKVVAKNSLLVFVNVLGKWVGMIVDAPNSTAAAFGNRVVSDTVTASDNTNVNNKGSITNNIDVNAHSGDANVANNTKAGDATSGDATASANIANIDTSEFDVSDWFGVLFINVFGTWIGSFGVDTAAGTVTPLSGMALPSGTPPVSGPNLRFGFIPQNAPQSQTSALGLSANGGSGGPGGPGQILSAAAGQKVPVPGVPMAQYRYNPANDPFNYILMSGGFLMAGVSASWYVLRRYLDSRKGGVGGDGGAAVTARDTGLVITH